MMDFINIRKLFDINDDCGFDEKELEETEKRIGRLPEVLREYYINLGRVQALNNSQDRLLNPNEIKDLGEYIEFYMENQYVCRWCIAKKDLKTENPPVYITYDGEDFFQESNSVLEFLETMAHLQGIWGIDYGCEEILDIEEEGADVIRNKFKKKDIQSLKEWMNVEFFGDYDDVVIALIKNEDFYNLCYAANSEDHFNEIDEFIEENVLD